MKEYVPITREEVKKDKKKNNEILGIIATFVFTIIIGGILISGVLF